MHQRKTLVTLVVLAIIGSANFLGKEVPATDYKNLQILPKDISKERLQSIMDGFNAAMGVKCGFCHVKNKETNEWDHASDAKGHKKEAREMMRMTAELNEKYFGVDMSEENPKVAITCYTCHRGEEHPVFEVKPAANALDSLKKRQ